MIDPAAAIKATEIQKNEDLSKTKTEEISSLGKAIVHANRELEREHHRPKNKYDKLDGDNDD